MTPNEIRRVIDLFRDTENYFMSFIGVAQQLSQEGKPQLLIKLNYKLNDIQGAIQIYERMYQQASENEKICTDIFNDAYKFNINVMSQINDNMRKTFENIRRKWNHK